MIFFLLILVALVIAGFRISDGNCSFYDMSNTNAVKGVFILLFFFCQIFPVISVAEAGFSPICDMTAKSFIKNVGLLLVVMFLFYFGFGVMESIQSKGMTYVKSTSLKKILFSLANYDVAIVVFHAMNLFLGIHYLVRQYILSFCFPRKIFNQCQK